MYTLSIHLLNAILTQVLHAKRPLPQTLIGVYMMNTKEKKKERVSVHTLIDAAISTNKPTNVPLYEIAQRCGLSRPNSKKATPVMSMLRKGSMRLPIDKVIVVADELGIDRRTLFMAQLRDSVFTLVVKTSIPSIPDPKIREESPKEIELRKTATVINAHERRSAKSTLEDLESMFSSTHEEHESPLLEAFREVEGEIGHKIALDSSIIDNFKNLLRDQYSL